MMFYKDTNAMVYSANGATYVFDIVAGVLHGHTLAPLIPFLFIICLDYVLWMSRELMKTMVSYKKMQQTDNIPQKL